MTAQQFEQLIPVGKQHQYLSSLVLADEIRGWFQENGTLAFEHGYQPKTFNFKGDTYRPYMCNESGVSVRNVETKEIYRISWHWLPKKTLLKIAKECNDYYYYVQTEG